MPDIFELAAILAKSILYFGALTSAGAVIARLVFASFVTEILSDLKRFALRCAAIGFVAALVGFALRGAALTGDASGITDPDILGLMWQTPVGSALLVRIVGLAMMILGLILGGFGWILAVLGAAGTLWSFSTIGHVADGAAAWTRLVLFFHLVAVSFWIGILFPLGRLVTHSHTMVVAGQLGHRFGQIASAMIPMLVLAGLFLSWKLVGSWGALFSTSYGANLLAKLLAAAALLSLGALNKFEIVPKLVSADKAASQRLARALKKEWIAFILVFIATATLTTLFSAPTG